MGRMNVWPHMRLNLEAYRIWRYGYQFISGMKRVSCRENRAQVLSLRLIIEMNGRDCWLFLELILKRKVGMNQVTIIQGREAI